MAATPPGGGRPPKLPLVPFGKSLSSTWQSPKAVELFSDDVQIVYKQHDAPGYTRPEIGSAHPEVKNFPDHTLMLVVRDGENAQDKLVYTIARDPVVSYSTNDVGQVQTVTESVVADDATLPTASALLSYKFDNLANSLAKKTTFVVPSVFGANTYAKQIPDVVPERFRVAVPTATTSVRSAGTAAAPTLSTGDLAKSEKQVTTFVKESSTTTRSAVSLPVSLVSKDTNDARQIVTKTETLQTSATTPATPSALQTVKVDNLGDSTVLQTVDAVPSVFANKLLSVGTADVLPLRFRSASGVSTTKQTASGTITDPLSLGAGEVERTEEQIDTFRKRTSVTSKSLIVTPTLYGQEYEQQFDVVIPYIETLEVSGTSLGDNRKDITPLSDQLDLVKTIDPTAAAAAFDDYLLAIPGTVNLVLPDVLTGLTCFMSTGYGDGTHTESGIGNGSGTTWGWSWSKSGSSQNSASAIPKVIPFIKQYWGRNTPSTRYFFFLPAPVTAAAVLAKLATLTGQTINAWPKFRPESVTVFLAGQKKSVAVESKGQAQASYHASGTGASSQVSSATASSSGSGTSHDVSTSADHLYVPPTIHGFITISGLVATVVGTAGAQASVSPISFNATTPSSIPTSGLYLHDSHADPFRYGYARVFAEVVDFANV